MFNRIISKQPLVKYPSSDNVPLFTFHRWLANLQILDIEEIKTVPYAPMSQRFYSNDECLIVIIEFFCKQN